MRRNQRSYPSSTFVIRFWRDWSTAGERWRGQIEHVQSGERMPFLELDDLLAFIRRFKIMLDDGSWGEDERR